MLKLTPIVCQTEQSLNKIKNYKLNLSADLDLVKTRSSLRWERFNRNKIKSNSSSANNNISPNEMKITAINISNSRYSIPKKAAFHPNLQIISKVLLADQEIWINRKECLVKNRRHLYDLLSQKKKEKVRKQMENNSKIAPIEYATSYPYFMSQLNKNEQVKAKSNQKQVLRDGILKPKSKLKDKNKN